MFRHTAFCAIFSVLLFSPLAAAKAQSAGESSITIEKAKVVAVVSEREGVVPGTDIAATYQTLRAEILSGSEKGKIVTIENDYLALSEGDVFYLTHTRDTELEIDSYAVFEPYRIPALGVLLGVFILAVLVIGGWTGLRGLLALVVSILTVFYVLLPGISAGYSPVMVAFFVSAIIVVFGSYLTHRVTLTTTAAVLGLLATVGITALLAHVAVAATHLTGFGDENAVYLHFATHGSIDFVGLFLGAMLIGALGILYDAAIGQAVAVEELLRAAPQASRRWIFARAMRIGREHIGALVNTLAIAYVGVALPLLLLFQSFGGEPFLQTINREIFAAEIVRTLVGSLGILLAVPVSTLAAILLLTRTSSSSVVSSGYMKLIVHWIVAAVAIGVASYLVPGTDVTVPGALVAAVVLAALNLLIRPLILVLTLPLNVLTLGLFTLVINALLVMLASVLVPGFDVAGFLSAFLFGIVLAVVNWLFSAWSRN